jgi:predicted O-methyltransferase YrrM
MITDQTIPEVAVPTEECPNPTLWQCYDGVATEVETVQLLYALVRAIKPTTIVETGTYLGAGTVWLARAVKDNKKGFVHSCDCDPGAVQSAKLLLDRENLLHHVNVERIDSLSFIRQFPEIDFAFLDSSMEGRVKEAELVLPVLSPRGFIAVHDTNTHHARVNGGPRNGIHALAERERLQMIQFDTPRGFTLLKKAN